MASIAMALGGNFVADDYKTEPRTFEVLPPNNYRVVITDSDLKETARGGQMLKLNLQVQGGEFNNRVVFDNINIVCPGSDIAERIGRERLSTICNIIGVSQLKDTSQLHGKPLMARIAIRKSDQYGDQNEVKGYMPLAAAPKPQAVKPVAKTAQPVAAGDDDDDLDVPF